MATVASTFVRRSASRFGARTCIPVTQAARHMSGGNRGVVYMGPDKVEIQDTPFPELSLAAGEFNPRLRKCEHGVILKVVTTNICGSDQHMVRGRTTAKPGFVLGHEITGEVIETGSDVEFIKKGDLCSVPFNIACGRCALCKAGHTGVCLNVNPARPGAAYGYVDMGGWIGGQSEYVMIPYADFNLLKFPDYDQAMEKIKSLTTLSDIFPTGFHGAIQAGVHAGATVYVAGAGPVGLASALGCHLLGAACVIVGDYNQERLAQARSFGCETVDVSSDVSLEDQLINILGVPEVDCGIDCVGFEARGCGCAGHQAEVPAQVLNDMMAVTKAAGSIGIPGLYVTGDPGAVDDAAKEGNISTRFGLGWAKSLSLHTGQCPVIRYHRQLMNAILYDKVDVSKAVNVEVISLDEAPQGYKDFDKGAAKKYVIDPHGMVA